LAQTLGSTTTAAVLPDMKSSNLIGAPASWTSTWAFEDVIVESGTNYCIESMNILDYAKARYSATSVLAVHYAGDYGGDAAAGARIAAEQLGLTFAAVETAPGVEAQAGAIAKIVSTNPSVVIVSTSPTETAAIVGGAAAQGYKGRFIGSGPTWNPALLKSPSAAALTASYENSSYFGAWGADSPGHEAMRDALKSVTTPNDGYTYGWVWSYPIKAALEKAAANKDLSRAGLVAAVKQLTSVDYEGMLPDGNGNFAAGVDGISRVSQISKVDATAPTGISVVEEFKAGPTATAFKLTQPCYATS
jgi:ABC-type branched-subunit amino acid transport system substrate-binding protein